MMVDQQYWDGFYPGHSFDYVPGADATGQLIPKLLPPARAGHNAAEFGYFSDRYLFKVAGRVWSNVFCGSSSIRPTWRIMSLQR